MWVCKKKWLLRTDWRCNKWLTVNPKRSQAVVEAGIDQLTFLNGMIFKEQHKRS